MIQQITPDRRVEGVRVERQSLGAGLHRVDPARAADLHHRRRLVNGPHESPTLGRSLRDEARTRAHIQHPGPGTDRRGVQQRPDAAAGQITERTRIRNGAPLPRQTLPLAELLELLLTHGNHVSLLPVRARTDQLSAPVSQ